MRLVSIRAIRTEPWNYAYQRCGIYLEDSFVRSTIRDSLKGELDPYRFGLTATMDEDGDLSWAWW